MANETQLNQNIHKDTNATVVNSGVVENVTILNKEISTGMMINKETILCERYTVVQKLDIVTGEADLYICESDRKQYIAKVYRRQIAIKKEILMAIMKIDSPYIAKLYDTGNYNGYPVEILPYYKNGSLQGRKYSFEDLRDKIIPSLNEGLNVLHRHGIIHKDLKPSNIMITDDEKNVAIIDFGISSVRQSANTVIVTQTGMTPEYSAPETFKNLFLNESDYYSLGITIYELFCGYTPYNNMNMEEIEQYVSVQKIPFPKNMPEELKNFISAVTYYDITNRRNKTNPNRRWIYEEVKKWCEGIIQTNPGEGLFNTGEIRTYTFLGKAYDDKADLVYALAENWNEGKKQLFRGLLSGFYKSFDPETAGYCLDAEDEATANSENEDIVFWRLLYTLDKATKKFLWMGKIYDGLPELGADLLERLQKNDKSLNNCAESILSNGILSEYINLLDPKNNEMISAVGGLEKSYRVFENGSREKQMILFLMGYMLSGQKIMVVDNQQFHNMEELTLYMSSLMERSYEQFEELCHRLLEQDGKLNMQFESWLISLGKKNEISRWYESDLN